MRHIKYWLTTVVVLLYSVVANAQQHYEVDGIYYVLDYYNDAAHVVQSNADEGYTGDIIIPSSITYDGKTFQVEGISSEAFMNDNVTSVVIPEGVDQIGNRAFSGCSSLIDVAIPSSVREVGEHAFSHCNSLKNIDMPAGISGIKKYTFYDCDSLASVNIPNSVSWIGDYAFENCYSLKSVDIPEGVSQIGFNTFSGCRSLASVTLPSSLTVIRSSAFSGCAFSNLTLPDAITKIEFNAFAGCKNLKSIVIPGGVSVIEGYAFSNCTSLAALVVSEGVEEIAECAFSNCDSLVSMSLPQSLTSIGANAFADCDKIIEVKIPQNVAQIGSFAFSSCKSLKAINLPDGLKKIEDNTFSGCLNLTDVDFSDSLEKIGPRAFYNCGFSSVSIPASVRMVGAAAFSSCKNLTSVEFADGAVEIGDNVFCYCENLVSVTLSETLKTIGKEAFRGCHKLEVIDIPATVTSIGESAFFECGLTSVTIPEGVETIESGVFAHCGNLMSAVLPNSITEIKQSAFTNSGIVHITIPEGATEINPYTFYNCKKLESVVIPEGVTKIGQEAFCGCALTSIILPSSMEEVGYYTFGGCKSLQTIVCKALTPPLCVPNSNYVAFDNDIKSSCVLYVPDDSVAIYQVAKEWKDFTNIRPLSHKEKYYTLTYLVDGEVYYTDSLKSGMNIVLLDEPIKEGYTFSGWSEVPETMPAEDLTISGTFTTNKYLVTFKIDDEVIASDSLEYGATIVAPEAPEKEGYTFNGWGEVAETVPASDVTYEGTYSVNSYTITYSVDGEVVHSESVTYGTTIVALEEPTKEGHTFSGWNEVPETMPAKDITISGTFTVNKYLVTFKIGDEVIVSDSLEYGAVIVVPEAPDKEGHTFNGWGEVAETVPAGDVTYEGTYTVNIYKVYYYVGDELVHTAEVAYGEPIPEYIYEPEEEGYTFLGWVGETYATMPAHDVTYTANIDNGIGQLTIDSGQLTIYDLAGRKVTDTENLKGGIYIVNGRKVVIK